MERTEIFHRSAHPGLILSLVVVSAVMSALPAMAVPRGIGFSDRHVFGPESEVEIEIFCPFDEIPSRGFVPFDIEVRNKLGKDVTVVIACTFSNSSYGPGSRFESNYKITTKQRSTQKSTVVVPIPTHFSSAYGYANLSGNLNFLVSGYGRNSSYFHSSTNRPEFLVCPKSTDIVPGRTGKPIYDRGQEIGALGFVPDRLPADWRAYTGFDVIACRATSWVDVPKPARRAIGEWVKLGGRLVLWDRSETTLKTVRNDLEALDAKNAGLGKIILTTASNDSQAARLLRQGWNFKEKNLQHALEHSYEPSNWPLLESMGQRSFGTTLVVLVLIAFGILVGPFNLFSLAKAGRRHLLFITTPIISLVTSLLLAGFIFIQDGFGGSGKRFVLIESDPGQNKLFLTQEQTSRTGVVLNRAFETSDPAWITHVALKSSRWSYVHRDESVNARLSLNGSQFGGDWFRSRSEQAHFAQSVVQSRERLELHDPGTPDGSRPPQLLSTFRCTLENVYFFGRGGTLWVAPEVRSGSPVTLVKSNDDPVEAWQKIAAPLSGSLRNSTKSVTEDFQESFFFAAAKGDSVPVISAGPMDWESSALVYGNVHRQ
ncbi:MAG: hypothetical protein AAGJ79_03770 [Verrucomicrobiota bacterium]